MFFLHADAIQLPFKANIFHTVISLNLLHCIDDVKTSLKEIKRVLIDGGNSAITDPNNFSVTIGELNIAALVCDKSSATGLQIFHNGMSNILVQLLFFELLPYMWLLSYFLFISFTICCMGWATTVINRMVYRIMLSPQTLKSCWST